MDRIELRNITKEINLVNWRILSGFEKIQYFKPFIGKQTKVQAFIYDFFLAGEKCYSFQNHNTDLKIKYLSSDFSKETSEEVKFSIDLDAWNKNTEYVEANAHCIKKKCDITGIIREIRLEWDYGQFWFKITLDNCQILENQSVWLTNEYLGLPVLIDNYKDEREQYNLKREQLRISESIRREKEKQYQRIAVGVAIIIFTILMVLLFKLI